MASGERYLSSGMGFLGRAAVRRPLEGYWDSLMLSASTMDILSAGIDPF